MPTATCAKRNTALLYLSVFESTGSPCPCQGPTFRGHRIFLVASRLSSLPLLCSICWIQWCFVVLFDVVPYVEKSNPIYEFIDTVICVVWTPIWLPDECGLIFSRLLRESWYLIFVLSCENFWSNFVMSKDAKFLDFPTPANRCVVSSAFWPGCGAQPGFLGNTPTRIFAIACDPASSTRCMWTPAGHVVASENFPLVTDSIREPHSCRVYDIRRRKEPLSPDICQYSCSMVI